MNRKLLRPYSFLFDHPDTLAGEDTSLLYPVYLEEKISNNYLQKKPARSKQVIIGDKKVDFGDLIDAKGMSETLDGKYAVAKVALTISKKANLNFIRNVHIGQEFIKTADGHYYRVRSDASADFSFSAKRKGIHGRKFVSYSKLVTNEAIPGSVFTEGVSDSLAAVALARPDSFWSSRRHETLSPGESRVYGNIDSLRGI